MDYWAVKIDTNGNKLWDKRFGGSNGDLCTSVLATGDGGYLLTGGSHSGADGDKSQTSRGHHDFWTVRVDASGTKVWDKRFGSSGLDKGRVAVSTPDGGFLLAGKSDSNATDDKSQASRGGNDFWIIKIDADGNRPLHATDPDGDVLIWTLQTPPTNGTAVVSGTGLAPSTFSYAPNANFHGDDSLVAKVSDGNGSSDLITVNLTVTPVNDPPVIAQGAGPITFTIPEDAGAVSWSAWDKTFGGSGSETCNDVIATPDGGYLLAGSSSSEANGDKSEAGRGDKDFWAVKIDANGGKIWDKRFGGSGEDVCTSVVATAEVPHPDCKRMPDPTPPNGNFWKEESAWLSPWCRNQAHMANAKWPMLRKRSSPKA